MMPVGLCGLRKLSPHESPFFRRVGPQQYVSLAMSHPTNRRR
jgi:hypothetical protein